MDPRQTATATDRAALPQAGMEVVGATTYVTLTFRQSSRAVFSGVALQASTALDTGPWTTVTPDVMQSLGNDPITGDPIARWKVIVQPGQTKKFLRLADHPVKRLPGCRPKWAREAAFLCGFRSASGRMPEKGR